MHTAGPPAFNAEMELWFLWHCQLLRRPASENYVSYPENNFFCRNLRGQQQWKKPGTW